MSTGTFSADSLKKRLVSGGTWAFAGKLATTLSGAAISALLARLLSPEEMGAYFMTLSLVAAVTLLGQAGMNHAAVRLIAESMALGDTGRARNTVTTVLLAGLLVSTVLGIALWLGPGPWLAIRVFRSPLLGNLLVLMAIMIPASVLQGLQVATFQGFHDMRSATLFGGLIGTSCMVLVLTSLLFLAGHASLLEILLIAVCADLVGVSLASICIFRKIDGLVGEGSLENSELLRLSVPVLMTSLALWLLTQSDLWILGFFRSTREVALYGAASRLVLLIAVSPTVVNTVVAPLISELYAQRRLAELERMLRGTATAVLAPACIVLVIFLMAGNHLLALVFGGLYGEAVSVLGLLAVGHATHVWSGSCGLTLIMTGHAPTMMRITFFSGALSVISALALVKGYGITGVALSTMFGLILQSLLLLVYAKRRAGIWTHARLAWPDYRLLWAGGKHV